MRSGGCRKIGVLLAASAALVFSATAHANRLDDIKARGTLICGTLADSEPLGFPDPHTGQIIGFAVDMCGAVARELGVRLEQRSLTVARRIPELVQGHVDLVVAALGYTRQRARRIDFTDAYYQTPIRVIVRSDAGLDALADLNDKRIATISGSTPADYARRALPRATMVPYPDTPSSFLALARGEVDGLALSQVVGIRFVNESDGRFRFVHGTLAWEATAMGVKKGQPALLKAINEALRKLDGTGGIDAVWDRWYGPHTQFNLQRDKPLIPIICLRSAGIAPGC